METPHLRGPPGPVNSWVAVWVRRKRKRTNVIGAANSHICILTQKSVLVGERKRGSERERERERERDLVSLAPQIATCALILMRERVCVEERERERERKREKERERERDLVSLAPQIATSLPNLKRESVCV